MRNMKPLALVLCVAGFALPAAAQQDTRPGVAVLSFENGGSYGRTKDDYDALRRGIAGLMISELSRNSAVRLVDRAETARLLDEQALASAGRVDAATAAQVGKLVGARYMVTGSFIDMYGEFRIDARIINVETGEILKTVRSDPQLKDIKQLDRIIQSVAERVMAETRLAQLTPGPATQANAEVPTEALILYSRALLYEDHGEKAKAIEYYQKALQEFPAFTEAEMGLRKARGS